MRNPRVGLWLLVVMTASADAAVLCQKPAGAIVVRDTCRKKEFPVDLAQFGAVGPQGPEGAEGPAGPEGPEGPPGPSIGYSARLSTTIPLGEDGTMVTLLSLDVPEGNYVIAARVFGKTLVDPDGDPGNDYRYDCYLGDTNGGSDWSDSWIARVGRVPGVESYLPLHGTYSGPGPIAVICRAANGHPLQVQSAALTAIAVGAIE